MRGGGLKAMATAKKSETKRRVGKLEIKYIPGDWQSLRDEFLSEKRASRKRDSTVQDYYKHITTFFRRYPEAFETEEELSACVKDYLSKDVAPDTHNNRRQKLGTFFKWCIRTGILESDPTQYIEHAKTSFSGRPLTEEEVRRLLDSIDRGSFAGLRDFALILLQIDTGIRPNEALELMPGDLNLLAKKVIVRGNAAKTHEVRSMPMSPRLVRALNELIKMRPSNWNMESKEYSVAPVFCTNHGTRLSNRQWRARFKEHARQCGLDDASTYDLRHTFATLSLQNEADPLYIQEMLGHRGLEMTRRYVHHVTADRLMQLHEKVSPIQNIFDKQRYGEGRTIGRTVESKRRRG